MRNLNKFIGQLSLLYFLLRVSIIFLIILIPLLIFAFLSLFFPGAMKAYYLTFLYGSKVNIFLGQVKFKEKNLTTLKENRNYLIVSNHRSHLDMFLLLANVYRLRAVANANLFQIPLLGHFMKLSKQFPMERGRVETYKSALENIKKAFSFGDIVLFFPEMTRCLPGHVGIQKFRLTAFQLARENNIKIIPVVISGTDQVWPKGLSETNFSRPVSMRALEVIDPAQFPTSVDLSLYIHELMEKNLLEMNV